MSDLHDELTAISGIGDARADEIIDVFDTPATRNTSEAQDALREALDYLEAGRPGYAEKFIRRALEG